jgi:3-oxoisoapionate-4-phosphate decarboxylase
MSASASFITLTYLIETAGSPEKLAAKIASDQSTGTFVPVPGETEELKDRVAARVMAIRALPPIAQSSFSDFVSRSLPSGRSGYCFSP